MKVQQSGGITHYNRVVDTNKPIVLHVMRVRIIKLFVKKCITVTGVLEYTERVEQRY